MHSGANLNDSDKAALKKLNEEDSTLSNAFLTKLLAATKDAAYVTTDKSALAGFSDEKIAAAAEAAKDRKMRRETDRLCERAFEAQQKTARRKPAPTVRWNSGSMAETHPCGQDGDAE